MILCHKYKFIYIKTMKVAGTSLELVLSRLCDYDDIISKDEPKEEELKKKVARGQQNNLFFIPRPSYKNIYHNIKQLIKFFLLTFGLGNFKYKVKFINNFNNEKFHSHLSASAIKRIVGNQIWKNYYKFTIVRNPYDQIVSYYYWANKTAEQRNKISFNEFVKKFSKEFFEKQYNIYTQNHQSLVDKFIFFEEFEKDLNFVSKKLNLPFNLFETFKNIKTKHYIRPQESKMSIIDAE